MTVLSNRFQSTHSLRSATRNTGHGPGPPEVSIHALLAECDFVIRLQSRFRCSFNPRTPCGVRRAKVLAINEFIPVSIHALLAECDRPVRLRPDELFCFNPRTPCGVRQASVCSGRHAIAGFNPRTPCGVRRRGGIFNLVLLIVSIHALLAECDSPAKHGFPAGGSFNPRTPCGVRPI